MITRASLRVPVRVVIFGCALSLLACRDIAGIEPITYSDSGAVACNGVTPTSVFSSTASYDNIAAQGGFVYAEITSSGVDRCATSGCTAPTNVLNGSKGSLAFVSFALAATSIDYTLQGTAADGGLGGEIHSIGLDGTSDALLQGGLDTPAFIAASGTRIFWIDDTNAVSGTPDTVSCIGCSGPQSAAWITGLGATYGLVADANTVYVLADAANLTDDALFACSTQTACKGTPRTVISGLGQATTPVQIASDGTFAYVAREDHADIVRIDATGQVTQVVMSQDVVAIAVDAIGGNVYYATATGVIGRTKSDGSTPAGTTLGCTAQTVFAVAVDDQSVYFLAGDTTSIIYKLPK